MMKKQQSVDDENGNLAVESSLSVEMQHGHHTSTNQQQQQQEEELADANCDEEYWPTMAHPTTQHEVHTIDFGNSVGVLKYKSISSDAMTPLDMTYHSQQELDEFHDGTGHLLWLAAVTLAHLLAYRVESLQPYLPEFVETSETINICELGCGTGGGGMALILFHCLRKQQQRQQREQNTLIPKFHVVFTDNDAESLELCRSNCELNGIDPQLYSQKLLWWGREHLSYDDDGGDDYDDGNDHSSMLLRANSFHTVLATDVVYDLKLIRPLLETAYHLLKKDDTTSYFILSHVPRFCIPKPDDAEIDTTSDETSLPGDGDNFFNDTRPFVALEKYIVAQAALMGLILVETIRPAKELVNRIPLASFDDNLENSDVTQHLTIHAIEEAHAVVFIFSALPSKELV
ncbi:lysine methyltransferase [Nitzschia inconspicua]|uniref:Lysine methyltransferase n=1 Tax=Nitzschia inconspicua TaxID=303405 RepID=A0A9K3KU56_9STRA|nr:lysine methyltransferase [Nitzschia inconspicua]